MLIDFILRELRRQPGVVIPDAAGTAAMVAAHETYGGERHYVPKLPKFQKAARIAQVESEGVTQPEEIVRRTGISRAQVFRVRRR
jgi:hypothetical protein